jgi:hypothetical protein
MLAKTAAALFFALLAAGACHRAGRESKSDDAAAVSATALPMRAAAPAASSTASDGGPQGDLEAEACEEMQRCVAKYAKPKLASADIARFLREGRAACFRPQWQKTVPASCFQFPPLGVDGRNGKLVDVQYEVCCGDVLAPDQGSIALRYHAVPSTECCARGGDPVVSGAWGNYLGCAPPETQDVSLWRDPRRPGGPLEPATLSACHPGKLIFKDGFMAPNPAAVCQKAREPDAFGQRITCRVARPSPGH